MTKEKTSEKDYLFCTERLPSRERLFQKYAGTVRALADFYGFEGMSPSFLADAHFFLPLAKANFFRERVPISLNLPPECGAYVRFSGALSLLQAYVSHRMSDLPQPLRLFFEGPVFYASPEEKGRIVAKDEAGLLMIGEEAPVAEAEIALMIWKALKEMNCGEETAELIVNATGCSQCRPQFRSAFLAYFRSRAARMCKDCKRDLKAAPTRVLLCKEERCAFLASHAPQILDYICERCKRHLKGFLEFLDEVEVPYFLDAKLFREGSWFNALVFEFAADAESLAEERSGGTARTQKERLILAEGGRISRAGELIVGKACSAVCGTLFLDAVEEVSIRKGVAFPDLQKPKVFLAQLGEFAKRKSLRMLEVLRVHGIEARETLGRDSIKAQLKVAEHMGVQIALILGQKEAIDETIIIREMESGIQEIIPQEKLVEFLMRKLRK